MEPSPHAATGSSTGEERPADRGETLVELLITIMIMGIVGAAFVGVFLMSITATAAMDSRVSTQAAALEWSQVIQDAPYVPCADPGDFPTLEQSVPDIPDDMVGVITSITVWSDSAENFVAIDDPCNDEGAQLITLGVSAGNLPAAESSFTLSIVNRTP